MFPKKNKLTRKDFSGSSFNGHKLHSSLFTLIYNKSVQNLRLGIIVSKKISKKAVYRNKIKRQIYAKLQNLIPDTNYKLLLIVKPQINSATTSEITQEIKNTLNKLK